MLSRALSDGSQIKRDCAASKTMDHSWMTVPMMKGGRVQEQLTRDLCLTLLLVFAGLAIVGYVEDDENVILLQSRAISTASQQSKSIVLL